MTQTAAFATAATPLVVTGISDPRSIGVARYAARLQAALAEHGVQYELGERSADGGSHHIHLANSSRRFLVERFERRGPVVVTAHDVIPRLPALHPVYRALVYPRLQRLDGAVVVHSTYAADLLRSVGVRRSSIEVVPHPAAPAPNIDRAAARTALGWPADAQIAVLPGVLKAVKCVAEILEASRESGWTIALAGKPADTRAVTAAQHAGALILDNPGDGAYGHAIAAADCVLCLRAGSVGESNGPLLDALGAGRAVLATATGSIPEVAGDAATFCTPDVVSIRAALAELASEPVRMEFEAAARRRANELSWSASAAVHAELFREVWR